MEAEKYDKVTSIQVTADTWEKLNRLKCQGDSFNTVISKLLTRDEAKLRTSEKE